MGDFNSTTYPRARKARKCDECGRPIAASERYSRTAAVWEGEFFTNVACRHCAVARFIVDEADNWYSEGFYGGLGDWLIESGYGEVWSLRLRVGSDRKWRCRYSDALMPLPENPWPAAEHLTRRIAEVPR
jgi:hypothetical protein